MNIFIGTSGWSYPEWKGIVYPKNLPQSSMFRYYSEFFHTSEINSTFYQIPSLNTVKVWSRNSPSNFKFSAKIPKLITHKAKLELDGSVENTIKGSIELLSNFIRNMMPLISENKIIAFLLQLPPKFGNQGKNDFKKLENFAEHWNSEIREKLESLDLNPPDLAVEFRNKYWMLDENIVNTFKMLKKHDLVHCCVVEPLLRPLIKFASESLFYIRFHGYGDKPWFNYNFTDEQLEHWAENLKPIINKIRAKKDSKQRAVLYFNNHFSGYAIKNAFYLSKLLDLPVKRRVRDLKKPLNVLVKSQKSLDDFF